MESHHILASKFGECFQYGDATKLQHRSLVSVSNMKMPLNFTCRSLVMDAIHKGKSLMSRKV
jgi:hypothetical protein